MRIYGSFSLKIGFFFIQEGENKNLVSGFSGVFKKQGVVEV